MRNIICEETAEFKSMEDLRIIKQSIIRGSNKAYTLYSYNPPRSAQSWVNTEVLVEHPSRLVHNSCYLDVPKDWLGEMFIEQAEMLKATNERAYNNEYLGEVTGNGGNVFENVEVRDISQAEIDSLQWFYQGVDWGFFPDPFQWVRCGFDSKHRILYILDEYRVNKAGNKETFDAVASKLSKDEPLTADSAEPKSISDWKEYGAWWIRGVVKGAGSVAYSTKWLAALSKIVINPKCENAAKEFTLYEFEKNNSGEFVSSYPDHDNHCLTADTLVDTVNGQIPIIDLVGKDGLVNCYDEQNERATTARFFNVRQTGYEEIFEITLKDGRTVKASAEHPILTQRGWVAAAELTEDDSILQL